jgi:hypothetical protein
MGAFERRMLTVPTRKGDRTVEAKVYGGELAVHRSVADMPYAWSVTHVGTGLKCHPYGTDFGSEASATEFARELLASGVVLAFDTPEAAPRKSLEAMRAAWEGRRR